MALQPSWAERRTQSQMMVAEPEDLYSEEAEPKDVLALVAVQSSVA